MEKDNKATNPHKGHRSRMKEKYLTYGADIFETHELLEILLYYAIPQQDTNPLAHELMNRFGSLEAIFMAEPQELSGISGIKDSASILISLVNEINRRRELENVNKPRSYKSVDEIKEYLVKLFSGLNRERFYAFFFDNSSRFIDMICVSEGTVNATDSNIRKIVTRAMNCHASSVVVAHNHPGGRAIPSQEDVSATYDLTAALEIMGISLAEHYLVAGDKCVPIVYRTR